MLNGATPLKTVGQQLALFDDFITQTPEGYSNTIELFDAILRYSSRRVRTGPEPDVRTVLFKKKEFTVTISPANIRGIILMPGEREDLVEKALRKLAAEDSSRLHTERDQKDRPAFTLQFTMHSLRKVLRETGHGFKLKEIDEALRVLQGATIEIHGEAADNWLLGEVSGILTNYRYVKKRGDREGEKSFCEVKFHPLVTASIVERTFRRIDFTRLMRLKVDLARWIYQRMSHNYTQASVESQYNKDIAYNLSMQLILNESGMDKRGRMRDNLKVIRAALSELVKSDILIAYDEDLRRMKEPNKPGIGEIFDAVWKLRPSCKFIDDVVAANKAAIVMRASKPLLSRA